MKGRGGAGVGLTKSPSPFPLLQVPLPGGVRGGFVL